jgi:hypothetical protein
MTTKSFVVIMLPALTLALGAPGGAQSCTIVQNGDFSSYSSGHEGGPSRINNSAMGGYSNLTDQALTKNGVVTSSASTSTFLLTPTVPV